jgi:hypothetical protein
MRTKIPSDVGTYLNICQISADINQILEQYNTHWMPEKMKKHFIKMMKDANKLGLMAEKLAKVEWVE